MKPPISRCLWAVAVLVMIGLFVQQIRINIAISDEAYKRGWNDCKNEVIKIIEERQKAESVEYFIDHSEIK